jgi:hypothetical protein
MIKNKIGISILVLATLLIGMALIPAVSAQKEDNYSVTAEEAFKHANAHMISFIAADAPGFENWTGYIVQDGYTYLRIMTHCLLVRHMVIQDYLNAHTAVQNLHV